MATLQVRDFPDDLHKKLAELAEDEHRSLAQQVIVLLMHSLQQSDSLKRRRSKILDSLKASQPVKKTSNPAKLIREDRER